MRFEPTISLKVCFAFCSALEEEGIGQHSRQMSGMTPQQSFYPKSAKEQIDRVSFEVMPHQFNSLDSGCAESRPGGTKNKGSNKIFCFPNIKIILVIISKYKNVIIENENRLLNHFIHFQYKIMTTSTTTAPQLHKFPWHSVARQIWVLNV
jgi:hypothetical protein